MNSILNILFGQADTLLRHHPALTGAATALSVAYLLLSVNTFRTSYSYLTNIFIYPSC